MHKKEIYAETRRFTIEIPDTCPHCGKFMEAEHKGYYLDTQIMTVALSFRCPISTCHRYFILEYNIESIPGRTFGSIKNLIPYDYNGFQPPEISDNVKTLSPVFSETYVEATIAESKGLTNISGIAFRKAFEFLVKDFAAYQNPDRTEDIRKNSLNNVIDMFYKDMPKIKELLHLTRKIGNDETHYYREFDEIDITDLKKLIYNFSLYINMILDIEEFSKKTS